MIKVEQRGEESVDRLLERFRRRVKKSEKLQEWRERQEYTKPSKERRDARHKAKRREEERAKEDFGWDKNSKYYYKKQNNE